MLVSNQYSNRIKLIIWKDHGFKIIKDLFSKVCCVFGIYH